MRWQTPLPCGHAIEERHSGQIDRGLRTMRIHVRPPPTEADKGNTGTGDDRFARKEEQVMCLRAHQLRTCKAHNAHGPEPSPGPCARSGKLHVDQKVINTPSARNIKLVSGSVILAISSLLLPASSA